MVGTMKGIFFWFATLGVSLSLLGLLAGAQERRTTRPEEPSIYTETMEPELPAVSETHPDLLDKIPALTF